MSRRTMVRVLGFDPIEHVLPDVPTVFEPLGRPIHLAPAVPVVRDPRLSATAPPRALQSDARSGLSPQPVVMTVQSQPAVTAAIVPQIPVEMSPAVAPQTTFRMAMRQGWAARILDVMERFGLGTTMLEVDRFIRSWVIEIDSASTPDKAAWVHNTGLEKAMRTFSTAEFLHVKEQLDGVLSRWLLEHGYRTTADPTKVETIQYASSEPGQPTQATLPAVVTTTSQSASQTAASSSMVSQEPAPTLVVTQETPPEQTASETPSEPSGGMSWEDLLASLPTEGGGPPPTPPETGPVVPPKTMPAVRIVPTEAVMSGLRAGLILKVLGAGLVGAGATWGILSVLPKK